MSTKKRTIILSVQDDFSRQLREFANQMDKAENATYKFAKSASGSTGSFGQIAFSLNQMFGAAQGVYNTFNQIYQTANEWAMVSVQADRSRIALEAYAGSAEEAAHWIDEVRRASRDTMTEGQAAAQAFQLMKFGLADTAEAAGQFVRDISIVAAINPQLNSTAEAMTQIQLVLANQSWLRLDQLGIAVADVKERMAELRAETKGLSSEEAFQIAVLEELHAQAAMVGDSILEITANQDKLKAAWGGFKEGVGRDINEAFEDIAGGLLDVVSYLETLEGMSAIEISVKVLTDFGTLINGAPKSVSTEQLNKLLGIEPAIVSSFDITAETPGMWQNMPVPMSTREQALAAGPAISASGAVPGWLMNEMSSNAVFAPSPEAQQKAIDDYWVSQWDQMLADRGVVSLAAGRRGSWGYVPPGETADSVRITNPSWLRDKDYGYGAGMAASGPNWRRNQWWGDVSARRQFGAVNAAGAAGGFEESTMMAWAQQQSTAAAQASMNSITGFGDALAGALGNAVDAAGDLVATFDSLDAKFGVGGSAFDKDVYGEMADALRNVEIDAGTAEEAMLAFEWATGLATGSSVLFDDRLAILTQRFADGELTATEYADAVRAFSLMDFSWVDKITAGMDFETAQQYIDAIANLTTFTGFGGGGMTQEEANPWLAGVGLGGGEQTSIFQPLIDDAATATGDITGYFATATGEMGESLVEFHNLHTGEYQSLAVEATGALETIRQKAQAVMGGTYTMTITTSAGDAGGQGEKPGWASGEFASGGYTGDGGRYDIAGVVHRGEYVVPSGGALVLRGGDSGGSQRIEIPVLLDGREIYRAIQEVDRQMSPSRIAS